MRDKVLEIFRRYAEGGSVQAARDAVGLCGRDFYRTLRDHPDLKEEYHRIQEDRGDMMIDESYVLSTDGQIDPHVARVQADIKMKVAGKFAPQRFGDRVALQVEAGPSLVSALELAKTRALLPSRDPAPALTAQVIDVESETVSQSRDTQSRISPVSDPIGLFDE